MKSFVFILCYVLGIVLARDVTPRNLHARGSFATSLSTAASNGSFTWDTKTFYVNEKAYQIIGSQIDPQRVPREYWAQRIQMAKAMGLNTIFSYLYWSHIEPHQGQFNFTGNNDVKAWFQEVQDAGMQAVLRPGPYICGEREWGGLPGWLTQISGMKIRSNNSPFLTATGNYLAKVGTQLQDLLITKGGPILMVQIENEYGYVGSDHSYTSALSKLLQTSFPNMKQYTNDGSQAGALRSGQVPGALSVIDGIDSKGGFTLRDSTITDKSSLGPLMNGEYWIRWFDAWGPRNGHSSYDGDSNGRSGRASELDWILTNGHHFSIYMFHGGISFAFGSGSGAAIYTNFRNSILKHTTNVPAVPSTPPLTAVAEFALTPMQGLFDDLPTPKASTSPVSMESLGQVFGYILYESTITASLSGKVQAGPGAPRDRVIVYVNGKKQGVMDAIYKTPATVNINVVNGDKLWLLVENLGRADNGFSDQTKGIIGDVTVGGTKVTGWNHYNFPLDNAPSLNGTKAVTANGPPVWYSGTFTTSQSGMAADTFLSLPGGVKGVVFVNGYNLGRYWTIGPQQELFVPGCYLHTGAANQVIVLELEPGTASRVAKGVATRTWKNNPDPDCSSCSWNEYTL
ncbi:glycosyl hydrolases family 35-domain-containing protein [Rhexocercosporidium sp. MPI-PUGE-AT-0058]|nr:glycosyl hydrolases family 35-domain-containing protein [Rhexocercosporidium sp. MPI-PUGE-AT-0058]